jgi:hypothetical protein
LSSREGCFDSNFAAESNDDGVKHGLMQLC